MFGDSITLTLGGAGGTARVCKKINQDNYSAEYLNRTTTDEIRMKIRHSVETPKNGAEPLERHNVEVTQTVFATATDPEIKRVSSTTVRCTAGDTGVQMSDVQDAVNLWLTSAVVDQLKGWES